VSIPFSHGTIRIDLLRYIAEVTSCDCMFVGKINVRWMWRRPVMGVRVPFNGNGQGC
jgi:hypothetical protein